MLFQHVFAKERNYTMMTDKGYISIHKIYLQPQCYYRIIMASGKVNSVDMAMVRGHTQWSLWE